MPNLFIRNLESLGALSPSDRAMIADACRKTMPICAGTVLLREGDRLDRLYVVLEGWLCDFRILPDGGRQILSLYLPGDMCRSPGFPLDHADEGIAALTPAVVATVPFATYRLWLEQRPQVRRAIWWSHLREQARLRQRLVSLGRRSAIERIAHFLCELWTRLSGASPASPDGRVELPLTQADIGDVLGLTTVHVNRVLQRLHSEGLIVLKHGLLGIPNLAALRAVAAFDPRYLEAQGSPWQSSHPASDRVPPPHFHAED